MFVIVFSLACQAQPDTGVCRARCYETVPWTPAGTPTDDPSSCWSQNGEDPYSSLVPMWCNEEGGCAGEWGTTYCEDGFELYWGNYLDDCIDCRLHHTPEGAIWFSCPWAEE